MDVVPAKVTAKVECFLDGQVGKVLGAESDDLALCHEARKLVLAGCGERGELDAGHF